SRQPGDLDPALLHVGGHRGNRPVALAQLTGIWKEVEQLALAQARATAGASLEQLVASSGELTVQLGDELERVRREHLVEAPAHRTPQIDIHSCRHRVILSVRARPMRTREDSRGLPRQAVFSTALQACWMKSAPPP